MEISSAECLAPSRRQSKAPFGQRRSHSSTSELESLLRQCDVVGPSETVEVLSTLAVSFANRLYPKVEFGVDLGRIKLGFEAMKFGRLDEEAGLQEGPYAMRLSANGALRATLTGKPSLELLHAVRTGSSHAELRRLFKAAVKEMP